MLPVIACVKGSNRAFVTPFCVGDTYAKSPARASFVGERIDFREFGSSGQTFTKEQIIQLLLANPIIRGEISDFQVSVLTPDIVHATYQAAGSLRSSLWIRERDQWRILFHQGTRLAT